jgi:hypothetical protein
MFSFFFFKKKGFERRLVRICGACQLNLDAHTDWMQHASMHVRIIDDRHTGLIIANYGLQKERKKARREALMLTE